MVWNKKKSGKKKFHVTWVTEGGGGGQEGKWSHFPPFFLLPFPYSLVEKNMAIQCKMCEKYFQKRKIKSRKQETKHLLTDADRSTNTKKSC